MSKLGKSFITLFILTLVPLVAVGRDNPLYDATAFVCDSLRTPLTTVADTTRTSPVFVAQRDSADAVKEEIEVYDPKFESVVFVPKKQWIAGISISYTQSNQNDYQFLILEDINGDTYSFRVTPMLAYAVAPDLAIGGKFSYSRNLTKLEKGSVVLDSETDYSVENLYRLSHNYSFMAIMRNYFSLGHSKRFGFFTEVQAQIGGGQSKIMQGKSTDITGTYERNFSLSVGVAPGLAVFLNNYSALEVNVGVLGFSYNHTKQITDRIYVADQKLKSANFRINLFSITFGVAFYL